MTATEKVILWYERGMYDTAAEAVASPLLTTDAERAAVSAALDGCE